MSLFVLEKFRICDKTGKLKILADTADTVFYRVLSFSNLNFQKTG